MPIWELVPRVRGLACIPLIISYLKGLWNAWSRLIPGFVTAPLKHSWARHLVRMFMASLQLTTFSLLGKYNSALHRQFPVQIHPRPPFTKYYSCTPHIFYRTQGFISQMSFGTPYSTRWYSIVQGWVHHCLKYILIKATYLSTFQ